MENVCTHIKNNFSILPHSPQADGHVPRNFRLVGGTYHSMCRCDWTPESAPSGCEGLQVHGGNLALSGHSPPPGYPGFGGTAAGWSLG